MNYDDYDQIARKHLKRIKEAVPVFNWSVGVTWPLHPDELILDSKSAISLVNDKLLEFFASININGEQLGIKVWFMITLLEDSALPVNEYIKSTIGYNLIDKIFEWKPQK